MKHDLAEESDEARDPNPLDVSSNREQTVKMKAMPISGKEQNSLDGMTAVGCQQYWGINPKVYYGQKNPTKYCPLEHSPCRAVQFPVSSGSPSNVFLVQTGCAKDAQLCSCSVTQAAFTKVPFLTPYLGQILPSLLVTALATWGSHCVEWQGLLWTWSGDEPWQRGCTLEQWGRGETVDTDCVVSDHLTSKQVTICSLLKLVNIWSLWITELKVRIISSWIWCVPLLLYPVLTDCAPSFPTSCKECTATKLDITLMLFHGHTDWHQVRPAEGIWIC